MKQTSRLALAAVTLTIAAYGFGQQPGGKGNAGAAATPAGQTTPGAAQPQGKRPPQAKTQPEFDAYTAAIAVTDPAAFEKAADDFAAKYPASELRVLLYKNGMRLYQNANNGDKMLDMAHKVLAIDPDDPEGLISVSEVLTERTRDTDLDKDQRYAEAMKDAQHALETVDTDVLIPAGTPQEKIDAYKGSLRSTAYSIIGAIQLSTDKYADAEASFRKSIDAYPQNPDPVVVLRLAIALDKQNKYPEALKEANQAVGLTQDGTNAGIMARRERDRLTQLTGGVAPAPGTTPAPASAPSSTPPAAKNPGA